MLGSFGCWVGENNGNLRKWLTGEARSLGRGYSQKRKKRYHKRVYWGCSPRGGGMERKDIHLRKMLDSKEGAKNR